MSFQCETDRPVPENCRQSVFFKGFNPLVDKRTIFDLFATVGTIVQFRVAHDRYGTSRGYGFVQYDNEESVRKAIKKVNAASFFGTKALVRQFIPREERARFFEEKIKFFTNLYVDNFGDSFTNRQLYRLFERYGKISSCKIMTDDQGKSKGYGFVAFAKPEAARRALENLNGNEILEGKRLFVDRAQRKEERKKQLQDTYKNCNVFVNNLHRNIKDDDLYNEFSCFGRIISAKVMVNQNGRSKGFGFVCFSTPEEAENAIEESKGSNICSNKLYIALAQSKEERRAQLTAQYVRKLAKDCRQHMEQSDQAGASYSGYMWSGEPNIQNRDSPSPQLDLGWPNSRPLGMSGAFSPLEDGSGASTSNDTQKYNFLDNLNYASTSNYSSVSSLQPLTASMLSQTSPKMQKEMIGERILSYVMLIVNNLNLAYKITGMLLEYDNADLLFMLDHKERLKNTVEEIKAVLQSDEGPRAPQKVEYSNAEPNMNKKKDDK